MASINLIPHEISPWGVIHGVRALGGWEEGPAGGVLARTGEGKGSAVSVPTP